MKWLIRWIEIRKRKMPGDKLRSGRLAIQPAAQYQRTRGYRVILCRRKEGSLHMSNPDVRQMFLQNHRDLSHIKRGKQLRRHESQAIRRIHLVDERASYLASCLLADDQVSMI